MGWYQYGVTHIHTQKRIGGTLMQSPPWGGATRVARNPRCLTLRIMTGTCPGKFISLSRSLLYVARFVGCVLESRSVGEEGRWAEGTLSSRKLKTEAIPLLFCWQIKYVIHHTWAFREFVEEAKRRVCYMCIYACVYIYMFLRGVKMISLLWEMKTAEQQLRWIPGFDDKKVHFWDFVQQRPNI